MGTHVWPAVGGITLIVHYLVAWHGYGLSLLPIRCLGLTWTIPRVQRASPLLTRSGNDCMLPSPHSTTRTWQSIWQVFQHQARYITPRAFTNRRDHKDFKIPASERPSCLSVISCAVFTHFLTQTFIATTQSLFQLLEFYLSA